MGLGHALLFLILGVVIALNYVRFRDVLYPAVIQSAMWTGILALYLLHRDVVFPLSTELYAILVGGVVLFSLGAYAATRSHQPVTAPLRDLDFDAKDWYVKVLVWLPILGLIPFLLTALALGQDGPYETLYRNMRRAAIGSESVSGGGVWGIWAYLIPISFISVALQILLERYRTHRFTFWSSVVIAACYALFATGRTFVLLLIIMSAGLLLITRRVSPLKTSAVALGVGLALFLALGVLVGKGGDVEFGLDLDLGTLWHVFVVYSLGSIPAFDTFLQMDLDWTWGQRVFRTIYAVLSEAGFEVEVQPLVQEYVFVPFPTNVYTVYQPYYGDFSIVGLLLAPLGLGYLHGVIYRKATEGHLFSIVLYALMLYPLVFQFFQDQYLSLLSFWIQFLVLIYLFFYRLRILRPS